MTKNNLFSRTWPEQPDATRWACVICGRHFSYVGFNNYGVEHADAPKYCPECGADAEDRPTTFPTLPEAARTVSMAMDAQLPETWADARRVPCEDQPLTTREIEALLHVAPYNDGIERMAIQELLERRRADREVQLRFMELGRDNVACNRVADLLVHHSTAQGAGTTKVLLAVVEGLLAQLEQATKLATKLATQVLEQTAPPLIPAARVVDIANQEVARAQEAVTRSKKESE